MISSLLQQNLQFQIDITTVKKILQKINSAPCLVRMNNFNNPIIFYDSGVGGLPYLHRAQQIIPNRQFIYIADHARFPYGGKSKKEIEIVVDNMVSTLIKRFNPTVIVVACNSATVSTIDLLRNRYKIPFIGVVPAVKPAAEISKKKKIGVMATSRTVSASYLNRLIDDFASDCEIIRIAAGEVVNFVENDFYKTSRQEKINFLKPILSPVKETGVDTLVLGCTHFIHLKNEIEEVLGKNVTVIDSVEGVGLQLKKVLSTLAISSQKRPSDNESQFYFTQNNENGQKTDEKKSIERANIYKYFADNFTLSFKGVL